MRPDPDGEPHRLPVYCRPQQREIARLLSAGLEHHAIARHLGISVSGVRFHIKALAQRLPGTLPASAKVVAWWRGATLEILK